MVTYAKSIYFHGDIENSTHVDDNVGHFNKLSQVIKVFDYALENKIPTEYHHNANYMYPAHILNVRYVNLCVLVEAFLVRYET